MSQPAGDVRDTYEVVAKLAEGGMGAIYQVRHRHLDQLRVIKVMKPQLGGDGDFEARFLREARLEAQLQHPNIAQLHEFEVTPSGAAYMVIEYIEGASLKQTLEAAGPLSVGAGLEIARQALEALSYLHERGFVHRDISPDNLMLSLDARDRPVVKLIDLGIAKKAREGGEQRITVTGTFLGKVHYASPEQFRGSDIDWRSDIYSFGIAFYELLTGEFPIRGSDTNSLIASHLFEPPKPFDETDPKGRIPEELRRIILRAMAKDREERFPSTKSFGDSLAALQTGHPLVPGEIRSILEAARTEPVPLREGDVVSILGTAPVSGTTATTILPDEDSAGAAPAREGWTDRLLGRPGRRGLRAAAGALLVGTVVAAGVHLIPKIEERGVGTESIGTGPDEIFREDAVLAQTLDFGSYHALVVGNDDYPALPRLDSAVRDARSVRDLLESRYGFRVTLLENATRADLFDALAGLRDTVGSDDSVLVYYAGHGTVVNDSPYWQLVDATATNTAQWVASDDVNYELEELGARHILVVADSCYSGTVAGQVVEASSPPARSGDSWRGYVETALGRRARLALSSGHFEEVVDRGIGGLHSPFATAFLSALEENDRILDGTTLYETLAPRVEAEAARLGITQRPVYTALDGDDEGAFFFLPRILEQAST